MEDVGLGPKALAALPIFPLPNAVLFPGALLPLHVFEPRYQAMTRDCLDGSKLMAIARLEPGYEGEYHGRPPVSSVCGVGRIIASEELDDGRYHILLRGVARVTIEEELPPDKPYRCVRARAVRDEINGSAAAIADYQTQLISLCDRLSMVLDKGGPELRELVRSEREPGPCADVIIAALIADNDERQHLLETFDPCDRLQRAVQHVGRLLVELGPRERMPN